MKSNIRVLIADGDKDFRAALSGALQAEDGIEVVAVVGDGISAQDSIRKGGIDLLLIDIMLPELDGLSVLRNVVDEGHHLGIFVISAFASDVVAMECTSLGVSHFFRKPIWPVGFGSGILPSRPIPCWLLRRQFPMIWSWNAA